MKNKIIVEIVFKVFKKAKNECSAHSKYALSKHVGDKIELSSKTLERAYDKYIENKKGINELSEVSLQLMCNYLGFDNYEQYIEKNNPTDKPPISTMQWLINLTIAIITIIIIVVSIIIFPYPDNPISIKTIEIKNEGCMTWVKNKYESIPCSDKPYSKYGTQILEYDSKMVTNFKKVNVTIGYDFFTDNHKKPLIWYYKNKKGEIEYFTAPGLHPVTGKTLDEITPYIIQKYVPVHSSKSNSFIQ